MKGNPSLCRGADGLCLRPVHGIELPACSRIFDSPVFGSRELRERKKFDVPTSLGNSIGETRQSDKSPRR